MTEQDRQTLNEVHAMLKAFTELYNEELAGRTISFEESPDPTDEPCPKIEYLK